MFFKVISSKKKIEGKFNMNMIESFPFIYFSNFLGIGMSQLFWIHSSMGTYFRFHACMVFFLIFFFHAIYLKVLFFSEQENILTQRNILLKFILISESTWTLMLYMVWNSAFRKDQSLCHSPMLLYINAQHT